MRNDDMFNAPDTDEDDKRLHSYGKSEVSGEHAVIVFVVLFLIVVVLFILKVKRILPQWAVLLASVVIMGVILAYFFRTKKNK